ncbi:MAG: 50S ribosomal protein L13 [bacterium]
MVQKTISTKYKGIKSVERNWHLINLKDKTLGRISSQIAYVLQGKNKSDYSTFLDSGDYVVAINAKRIKVTGNKAKEKEYLRYSGYPGGLKVKSFKEVMEQDARLIIKSAVSGMLPKNKLRKKRLSRLYIFPNEDHAYKEKFNLK